MKRTRYDYRGKTLRRQRIIATVLITSIEDTGVKFLRKLFSVLASTLEVHPVRYSNSN
jgi:hypothetical protein